MNELDIKKQKKGDIIVVSVIGEVNPSTEENLRKYFEKLSHDLKKSPKKIIFDFKNLEYINSTGLGILANFYRVCQEENIKVIISSLSPMCQRLFEITKLDRIFKVFGSMDEAIAELEK